MNFCNPHDFNNTHLIKTALCFMHSIALFLIIRHQDVCKTPGLSTSYEDKRTIKLSIGLKKNTNFSANNKFFV